LLFWVLFSTTSDIKITVMKRLLSNTNRLVQVLNAIGNGVIVQDTAGHLIFVNLAAARMMHCVSPEDAIQKGPAAIVAEFELRAESGQPLAPETLPGRRALAGEVEPGVIIGFRHKAGDTWRWTSLKASPVLDEEGEVILAVSVLEDVTAVKEAEMRLRDANDRITKLLAKAL
jgi:PAS domain S-box-containing protein